LFDFFLLLSEGFFYCASFFLVRKFAEVVGSFLHTIVLLFFNRMFGNYLPLLAS
jgi:hypothetical protein